MWVMATRYSEPYRAISLSQMGGYGSSTLCAYSQPSVTIQHLPDGGVLRYEQVNRALNQYGDAVNAMHDAAVVFAGTNATAPPATPTVQQVIYAGTNDLNLQGKPPASWWRRLWW